MTSRFARDDKVRSRSGEQSRKEAAVARLHSSRVGSWDKQPLTKQSRAIKRHASGCDCTRAELKRDHEGVSRGTRSLSDTTGDKMAVVAAPLSADEVVVHGLPKVMKGSLAAAALTAASVVAS